MFFHFAKGIQKASGTMNSEGLLRRVGKNVVNYKKKGGKK
jgi:hypothetical protein